jgi:Holliday junction resolvasome RuvABC endonuclease subunit
MKIIGIDPGTAITGIGIIEYDLKDFNLIHFDTDKSQSEKFHSRKIKDHL